MYKTNIKKYIDKIVKKIKFNQMIKKKKKNKGCGIWIDMNFYSTCIFYIFNY